MSLSKFQDFGRWGAYVITSGDAVEITKNTCRAGARIVQYREKNGSRKKVLESAKVIRDICSDYATIFIVNDYVDIALLANADGVHLGQDDIHIHEARKITPEDFIIGVSTHSLEQAKKAEADGADYIGIGPVFATPTKEDYSPIGVDTVKSVLGAISVPAAAIGGINLDNIEQLKSAGVVNVAMVRQFTVNADEAVKRVNEFLLGS